MTTVASSVWLTDVPRESSTLLLVACRKRRHLLSKPTPWEASHELERCDTGHCDKPDPDARQGLSATAREPLGSPASGPEVLPFLLMWLYAKLLNVSQTKRAGEQLGGRALAGHGRAQVPSPVLQKSKEYNKT